MQVPKQGAPRMRGITVAITMAQMIRAERHAYGTLMRAFLVSRADFFEDGGMLTVGVFIGFDCSPLYKETRRSKGNRKSKKILCGDSQAEGGGLDFSEPLGDCGA